MIKPRQLAKINKISETSRIMITIDKEDLTIVVNLIEIEVIYLVELEITLWKIVPSLLKR